MINAFDSSAVLRLLRWIAMLFSGSVFGRFGRAFLRVWQHSAVKKFCCARLDAPMSSSEHGWPHRLLALCSRLLAGWRRPVRWIRSSCCWRIWQAVLRVCSGSRIFGRVFRGGTDRVLLFGIALYVPVHFVMNRLSLPLLSSGWDELLLLVSVLFLIWRCMDRELPLKPRTTPMGMPIVLFLAVGLALMFAVRPWLGIAVSGYRATVQYILWFFVVYRLIRDEKDLLTVYLTFVIIAFVISLHGIWQYIIAVPIPDSWTDQAETAVRTRVYSIFGSPNIMGDFMVIFAPMTAALAYVTKDRRVGILCWLAAICMCLACLFTMSRAAWVAMAVAVLIFAVLQDRRILILMVVACCVAVFLPFVQTRIGYLFTDEYAASTSNGGRASRWALGISYLDYGSRWLGFGLGMFGGAVAMQNKILSWVSYFYMDNYYLKIFVEMGYLGLAAFLFMMASLLYVSLRCVRREKKRGSRLSPLTCGMIAGLSGTLVHCWFENIFEEPYMMAVFWTIAAMLLWLGFRHESSPAAEKNHG